MRYLVYLKPDDDLLISITVDADSLDEALRLGPKAMSNAKIFTPQAEWVGGSFRVSGVLEE